MIKIMSFNIRNGDAWDGADAWKHRRDLTAQVIRDFAPAVVGLQEAFRYQLDELGKRLPTYAEIGVGRDDGREAGEYTAILFQEDRLEVLDQSTFWFSDTPEVPGSMSWGNRITRICTWARFRDLGLNKVFYVFNLHWDHESQPSRERSAELLVNQIRQRNDGNAPVIVIGDFNVEEDNPAFRHLLEADVPLIDTFRAVPQQSKDIGTFHGFGGAHDGAKIDAVLASPDWYVESATIIHTHQNGRYPSDHFPITATLGMDE